MSIKNDRWSALSLKDRADLMNMYITNGISDLKEIKKHYNSFAPGGPIETDEYGYPADITPAVVEADYPRENEVWKIADASNADIVQRLKQGPSRVTIQDWEDPRKVATHKMMSASKYAVGNVQNINGQLFDFTDPKHGFKDPDRAAINSAIERGDYIKFDTEGDARYFAEHYKKHYNSFGDGGRILDGTETEQTLSGVGINTLVPLESREDYLNKQRQSAIDASLEKSYSRTNPDVPKRLKYANETSWREILEAKINYNKNLIRAYTPEDLIYESNVLEKQRLLDENALLTKELSEGYKEEYIDGASCIYTATGNYGDAHKCSWNVWFRENPEKYGFTEINLKDVKPGDIIQDFTNLEGIPNHALTFIGYDDSGKARYNYSSGGNDSKAIKKQAYYPYELDHGQFIHFTKDNAEDLQSAIAAYRFVGNEEENLKWNDDYNQYRKDYSSKILEELKDVPRLPIDKARILDGTEEEQTLSGKPLTRRVARSVYNYGSPEIVFDLNKTSGITEWYDNAYNTSSDTSPYPETETIVEEYIPQENIPARNRVENFNLIEPLQFINSFMKENILPKTIENNITSEIIKPISHSSISRESFKNYVINPIRSLRWKAQGFKGWSDEDLNYLYDKLGDAGWDPKALMYGIDRETNFRTHVKNKNTSAIGLAQLTKDQMKTLFGENADKIYEEYSNGTRSVRDVIDDTIKQYKWMYDRIKSEPENMGYGRLKINLLAPNASLDSVVSDVIYKHSLTTAQKKHLKKGVSTYRDLMKIYDKEFEDRFGK